ncbi:MAG TPA: DUF1801 domain-containing protein [Leptospiraceae bacterium]|nr:DUF1801 domain-containing protein [Leptospiraceae bacterium]
MKKQSIESVDSYVQSSPPEIQKKLRQLRSMIRSAAPAAVEKISYRMPTFFLNGNLVYFAAFKNHIGFYPGSKAIEKFSKELASYEGSKGTVRFPFDSPIPAALIKKIVRYRVKENLEKEAKRKSKKKKS